MYPWVFERIQRLEIEGLRGVRKGVIDGLTPLSILVGPNNSGKSTTLEALWMAARHHSISAVTQTLLRRGGPPLHGLQSIVSDGSKDATVTAVGASHAPNASSRIRASLEVIANLDPDLVGRAQAENIEGPFKQPQLTASGAWINTLVRTTTAMVVNRNGDFSHPTVVSGLDQERLPASFVDVEAVRASGAIEDAYSQLEKAGALKRITTALRRSMPKLADLRILKVDDDFILHTMFDDAKPVPAYLAGDGFKRLLQLAAGVTSREPKLAILEEPETFQHPRYLGELADIVRASVEAGSQVVLSTHNLELIDALLGDGSSDRSYVSVHRLRLVDGELRSTALDADTARNARAELAEDLRA